MINKCIEAVDLILDSIYSTGEKNQSIEFLITNPKESISFGNIGTTIYVRSEEDYLKALIFIKKNGLPYLSDLSLLNLRKTVTKLLTKNFWFIRHGEFSRIENISYKNQINSENKLELAKSLLNSELFQENFITYFYPTRSITSDITLRFDNFFIIPSNELSYKDINLDKSDINQFNFEYFPCLKNNHKIHVNTWIGIKASTEDNSRKILSVILGTIALFQSTSKRYLFNSLESDSGCNFITHDKFYNTMETVDLVPSLYFKIIIDKDLSPYFLKISETLTNKNIYDNLKFYSLNNFYKSWFQTEAEQFRTLCTCIESLIEDTSTKSSAKFKSLITKYCSEYSQDRLADLLKIRGSIVHGKSPNLCDSQAYNNYIEEYLSEPLNDLIKIVDIVLKAHIFN